MSLIYGKLHGFEHPINNTIEGKHHAYSANIRDHPQSTQRDLVRFIPRKNLSRTSWRRPFLKSLGRVIFRSRIGCNVQIGHMVEESPEDAPCSATACIR